MKNYLIAVFTLFVGLSMLANDAEAKRLGGGTSSGMRRDSGTMQKQATPPAAAPTSAAAAKPAPAAQPAAAPAPSGASRWLGPLAGLAAGVGLGALLGGAFGGLGGGLGSILSMLLMGLVAFFAIRFIMGMMKGKQQTPAYAPAGASPEAQAPARFESAPQQTPAIGGGLAPAPVIGGGVPGIGAGLAAQEETRGGSIPADFDVEGFVRQAKLNFVRLQAANDAGNMDDIREVTTPEMYAEIKLQLQERGNKTQNTDVVNLNADLLDVSTEDKRHVASVRFFGTLREDGTTESFDEVWHLVKPVDGSHGWTIAGIQQMQ